jgi:glycosyltransferase involved in cell wall biosynthesis
MEKNKVSVVTSVHNEEKFLKQCIESVLNQTFENFEYLIIDDASTDRTFEILKDFEKKDKRIKIFKNSFKKGPYSSANNVLKRCKGEYVARIDGDDIWFDSKLKKQVDFMQKEKCNFSCTYVQYIDENNKELHIHETPSGDDLNWCLNFYNPIRHSSVMWKGMIFYDKKFFLCGDYELFTRIRKNHKIFTLKEVTVKYRHHENSITNTQTKKQLELAKKIKKREFNFYLNKNLNYEEIEELENIYRNNSITQNQNFLELQKIFGRETLNHQT